MRFFKKGFVTAGIGILFFSFQSSLLASPTVSVPDFKNNADNVPWWSNRVGKQLSDVLSNELSNAGVKVVERGNVDAVLSEQELADLGIVSKTAKNNNTAKRGKMRGAQFIILGGVSSYDEGVSQKASSGGTSFMGMGESSSVQESNAYIAVDLRIVNSTTGEVVGSRTVEGTAKSTSKTKTSGGDFSMFGKIAQSNSNSRSSRMFNDITSSFKTSKTTVEVNKAPKEKAIRAALISAADYVNCVLVVRGSCLAEFEEQEKKRRAKTLDVLNFD
tara:strand:+ start:110 stop:931 length:822 start_codon:yes stop_codon:yes gene_type:complete